MTGRAEAKLLNSARTNPILARHLTRRLEKESKFVEALRTSAEALLVEAMNDTEWAPGLLRKLATLPDVPDSSRAMMLSAWIRWGDSWRNNVNNDVLLIDTLRNLLPPYRGGEVRLFRGDSAFNRRRRTYGMSWTVDRIVAESFAEGNASMYDGGTVVLETLAPSTAIICVPHDHIEHAYAGEVEYLVDRRRLGDVNLVKRYGAPAALAQ
ncbi:hypothetical protein [Bradyrhizobium guangzhouense]|uniref:Uncharacterized protein n=1 Tax=Bradyrhizobium guangzhouense TaxID=1325095 RepID=A0AAE5WW73_9BRAD|nr:hypothetical protein [Bradyrhizobium guangzhouense]QAU44197.1 hypothetical protein XH91_01715 [Bradyrhizobium guangzhouense]